MRRRTNSLTIFVIAACTLFGLKVHAQSVTKEQAATVCSHFLQERHQSTESIQLEEQIMSDDGNSCLYRFSLGEKGFVIVSGSTSVTPVLAYSFDEIYESVPSVNDILGIYKSGIKEADEKGQSSNPEVSEEWSHYLAAEFTPRQSKTPTQGPLLTTRWNQNMYYNTYCPWDAAAGSYYDYRVPNGCVALACAQILNYHQYPSQGQGAVIYLPTGYPMQTVYYNRHTYHYEAMCNEPQSYANEIAKLAYHLGVALKMQYGPDGSGAITEDVLEQLRDRFGYDWTMTHLSRDIYLDTNVNALIAILKNDIDARRPIYYSGGGHAFVIDGYDEAGKFHLNLGWGGASNGYYAMDNFAGFNDYGQYYVNIFPSGAVADPVCEGLKRQTASFGYVSDGSRPTKPYPANPNCSWMIAVPTATQYTFKFDRLDVNPDADVITIYNGPTVESGVMATITGNTPPTQSYTINADSVLITFTSNGSVSTNEDYYGFLISYTSQVASSTCSNISVVHDWSTIITDGSNDGENYVPESNCTWNVSLNFISGYSFNFRKFNLGYGDFVDVYDNTTIPATLYKRFDIENLPSGPYTVNFNKMKINFVADNWDQNDGFEFEYWALASIDDHSGIEDLNVYPNPATDNLNLRFSLTNPEEITCRLMDATGKLLSLETISASIGENHHSLNVSNLAKGFYMLEVSTSTGKSIRKVMVQ